MNSTRRLKVGAKIVLIENVPDFVTDEELAKFALKKMMEIGINHIGMAS